MADTKPHSVDIKRTCIVLELSDVPVLLLLTDTAAYSTAAALAPAEARKYQADRQVKVNIH